jgi:KaiC/GvpD/RAD55 family RecA-like ATPase
MERVPTGIKGFDELIEGGIPKGAMVLLSGGAGTCKTILATQFIYNGAKAYKEPGIFVTVESNVKNILWNVENFGWDVKGAEDAKLMNIYRLHLDPKKDVEAQVDAELNEIKAMVEKMGAQRLVVDSTTAFGVWVKEPGAMRTMLYRFANALKDIGCTTIITAETRGGRENFSAFGVEEFVSDAVIALYFTPPHRSVFVRKMRGTNHSKSVHPFEITASGVEVKPHDEVLWSAIK